MIVPLTEREVRLVIDWRQAAGGLFPDEDRVLRKLRGALDAAVAPDLSRLQVQIVLGWIEGQVEGRRGGGAVVTPEEASILGKVRRTLQGE